MGVGRGEAGMVLGMGVSFRQSRGWRGFGEMGVGPEEEEVGPDTHKYYRGEFRNHTQGILRRGYSLQKFETGTFFYSGVGEDGRDGRAGESKGPSGKFGQKMTRLNSFSLSCDGISGFFSGEGVGIWSRGILEEESRD